MVKPGDRVEITGIMPNDPSPLPVGLRGTVTYTSQEVGQIYVDWDPDENGHQRTLILLTTDPYRVIR